MVPAKTGQNAPMWSFEKIFIKEKSAVYSLVQK